MGDTRQTSPATALPSVESAVPPTTRAAFIRVRPGLAHSYLTLGGKSAGTGHEGLEARNKEGVSRALSMRPSSEPVPRRRARP